jgi:hypothetical protein
MAAAISILTNQHNAVPNLLRSLLFTQVIAAPLKLEVSAESRLTIAKSVPINTDPVPSALIPCFLSADRREGGFGMVSLKNGRLEQGLKPWRMITSDSEWKQRADQLRECSV